MVIIMVIMRITVGNERKTQKQQVKVQVCENYLVIGIAGVKIVDKRRWIK